MPAEWVADDEVFGVTESNWPSQRFARTVIAVVVGYWTASVVLFVLFDRDQTTLSAIAFIGWGAIVTVVWALCAILIFRDMRASGCATNDSLLAAATSILFWPVGIWLWRRSRRRNGRRIAGWWWGPAGILVDLARVPERGEGLDGRVE